MPTNENNQEIETNNVSTEALAAAALERARARAEAIPIADVMPVRLAISDAAFGVIANKDRIEMLRSDVERDLGDEGLSALDELVPAARYALIAQADHSAQGDADFEESAKALGEKRSRLFHIVSALVARRRGLKAPSLVGGQSYLGIVTDVVTMVRWFVGNASKLGEHAKLTTEELNAIQLEAEAFAAKVKKQDGASSTPTGLSRARAYTLFVQAYDRVRQVITFVRWEAGDVDQFAPSLFAGRARKGATEEEPATPVVAAPAAPTPIQPAPVVAPVVATPVTPEPVTPSEPIEPGMPGADPFLRNV